MVPRTDTPRLITRQDIASFFGMDRRRQLFKSLRPEAFVIIGGKTIELFDGRLLSSLAVNVANQGTPKLTNE